MAMEQAKHLVVLNLRQAWADMGVVTSLLVLLQGLGIKLSR